MSYILFNQLSIDVLYGFIYRYKKEKKLIIIIAVVVDKIQKVGGKKKKKKKLGGGDWPASRASMCNSD